MKRPVGITIIGVLLFIAGLLGLIIGISAIIPGTPLDTLWSLNPSIPAGFQLTLIGKLFGVFLLILGVIVLYTRYGLLKGRKWAWWITLIIFAANGIGDAARITLDGVFEGIFGLLIAVGFIYYLTRPEVRAFFEISQNDADKDK
jgi:hypothetical protein